MCARVASVIQALCVVEPAHVLTFNLFTSKQCRLGLHWILFSATIRAALNTHLSNCDGFIRQMKCIKYSIYIHFRSAVFV